VSRRNPDPETAPRVSCIGSSSSALVRLSLPIARHAVRAAGAGGNGPGDRSPAREARDTLSVLQELNEP